MSTISKFESQPGQDVLFSAWVTKVQKLGKQWFLILRDGPLPKSRVQVVLPSLIYDGPLTQESYVSISGKICPLPKGKRSYQSVEIQVSEIKILSLADPEFASRCPEDAGPDVRLSQRLFYLRTEIFATITKLRAVFLKACRDYFDSQDVTEIVPPCFVGTQCEGGATLFKLDHVGQAAYLTQSSQFYLEYCVPSQGDCYCLYPSFRAESSHTRRHLTEFLHLEAEWRNIQTMIQHCYKLRHMMTGIIQRFLELDRPLGLLQKLERRQAVEYYLAMLQDPLEPYPSESRCITMTHRQAIQYCREHGIYKDDEIHFDDLDDIPEAQERKMIDQIGKIVFLTHFPKHFKSFYMKCDPDDPTYVLGCDVEVPGVGEVIGSGIRETDATMLLERLREQGLKESEYTEYIELRRAGFGQTSGMGLGVDRVLTWLLGLYSIRDVVTFPRYPGRLFP